MGLMDILNGMQNGPAWPAAASARRQRRRHVAHDDGPARAARLQGHQGRRARQHTRWRFVAKPSTGRPSIRPARHNRGVLRRAG